MVTAKATPQEVEAFGRWPVVAASTASRTIGRPAATRLQKSLRSHHPAPAWTCARPAGPPSLERAMWRRLPAIRQGTQGDWGRRSGQVVCGRGIRLRGYPGWMEADVVVRSVERVRTRSGKVRYVVRDADGREFSTFRERIEEERAGFHNVYLDRIQPIAGGDAADTDPEEAAWRTAVEATPWLVGSGEPEREVPPEELFERLKPFKDRVADDIRSDQE
jgi:hypothetical protein